MKRAIFFSLFLVILALLPLGCGEDHRNDLSWVLSRYGKPEETDVEYSPDGIAYMILWYWSQGKGFKFKEETYLSVRGLECKERYYWRLIDEYNFQPTPSKEEREKIKRRFLGSEQGER